MAGFAGLTEETFATYAPEKWSSNAHNLPRMRAKDLALALADAAAGSSFGGLQRGSSDEVPNILNQKKVDSQWVYWTRTTDDKKVLGQFLEKLKLDGSALMGLAPHDKHIVAGLRISQDELWVGLRVASGASVDRRNLAAKLTKDSYQTGLVAILQKLPPGAAISLEDQHEAATIDAALVAALAPRLDPDANVDAPLRVGVGFSRDHAVAQGAALADEVAAIFPVLAELFRFCAWSRENDHTQVGQRLQEAEAEKKRQAFAFEPGQQVRITSGMFAGKLGRVEDIDSKAKVKVRVGTMSVVVPGTELKRAP